MDLSLDDLLSGLQAVQEKRATAKLSERNVIELVNKLKQLGLLDDELLHTTNGKEYITREQVKVEVQQAVADAGGRMPLVDLPSLIGVDLVHCEKAAEQLIKEGAGQEGGSTTMFQAQGELFTPLYFDGLAAEVGEGLQESGVVVLGEVARRFGLAADLLSSQLEARMGDIIQGRLEGGVIYTPAYLARVKAQLRGVLRGALAPVSMTALVNVLGLDGLGPLHALVPMLLEQLLGEGSIAGKLTGGSTSWVPAMFVRSQQEAVKRFFQQIGYIGYDTVSKYGIPAPRAFLQQHFPEGIALESAYVAPTVLDQVEACIEEAVQAGSWCDVQPMLPSILYPSDAAILLERCTHSLRAPSDSQVTILAKTCVLAPSFLEGVREVLLEESRKAAEEAHQTQKKAAPQGEGLKATVQTKKSAGAADSDDDDDWDTGKGKGKKGKGKKGKAAQPKAAGKQTKAGKQQPQHHATQSAGSALSVDSLAERIIALHPDIEGAGVDGELAADMAAELRPAVVAEYERALHAIFTAGAERRRRLREAAGAELDEAQQRLQLLCHGAELFCEDEATISSLQRHLLRTTAGDCMDALLRYLAADLASEGDSQGAGAESGESDTGAGSMAPSDRAAIVKQLGADVKPAVSIALEKLGGASLEEFIAEFTSAAEAAGLWLRKLDKKAERNRVADQQRSWEVQLGSETDPGNFLLVLVPLLVAKHLSRVVSLPGRALGAAVEKLKSVLPPKGYSLLADFHSAVVQQLRSQTEGEGERLRELMQEARQQLVGEKGGGEA